MVQMWAWAQFAELWSICRLFKKQATTLQCRKVMKDGWNS